MRAKEFIGEGLKQGKLSKRQQEPTRGLIKYGDKQHISGDYVGFKLGQAMAASDGKSPVDIDALSWHGKKKTVHPYTEEEQNMFKMAAKAVGADYQDLNNGNLNSCELNSTNKVSPVKGFKGWKK
jgi:hypothetical protein